jgi:hypothetical protein
MDSSSTSHFGFQSISKSMSCKEDGDVMTQENAHAILKATTTPIQNKTIGSMSISKRRSKTLLKDFSKHNNIIHGSRVHHQ